MTAPHFTLRIEVAPIDIRVHSALDHEILDALASLEKVIMTTRDEFIGQINDLKTQLDTANATLVKSQSEITAAVTANSANVATLNQKIADLESAIAAGGSDVPPEVIAAFAGAKASADTVTTSSDALDSLNPDTP